jgi:DNA-binding NarL/FixJ family response regulator
MKDPAVHIVCHWLQPEQPVALAFDPDILGTLALNEVSRRVRPRLGGDMTSILIVEDHPMFREAVQSAVLAALPDAGIHEASTISELLECAPDKESFDLILLDLMLPGVSGFDGFLLARSRFPQTPVLIFSGLNDAKIAAEALRIGAAGFVPKSSNKAVLSEAIKEIYAGNVYIPKDMAREVRTLLSTAKEPGDIATRVAALTPSQIRVLQLLRQGLLNKQIAHELGVGETTVKAHVSEILRRLNVASRTQAVIETAHLDFGTFLNRQPKS